MTLTILFDLDDTLLINDVNRFLPAYLKLLSQQLSQWQPDEVIQHLMAATRQMLVKTLPARTLEETFNAHFYPALGASPSTLQPAIDHFYAQAYPALQPLTSPRQMAQALVSHLSRADHTLVVATNPLFPATAIRQRLAWAGFPLDQTLFNLVTDFSTFHFSKPHPAFYAEILAQCGWRQQPAVMIGDNLQDDIIPASQLGLPTFWLNGKESLPDIAHPLSRSGSFEEISAWLDVIENSTTQESPATPQAVLAVLQSTPAALSQLVKHLSPDQWLNKPSTADWSLTETLCHMRDVDLEVNIPRFDQIIQDSNPFLPGVLSDNWAEERNYQAQDGRLALEQFLQARTSLLQLLQALNPQDWQKSARHAIFGPTDLLELASFIATHDKNHIQHVVKLANS